MPYPSVTVYPSPNTYPGLQSNLAENTNVFMPTYMFGEWAFIRGAARLMIADYGKTFPTKISDIIDLDTYAAQTEWFDLGATKGGISLGLKSYQETLTLDQETGNIRTQQFGHEFGVSTRLSEANLEKFQLIWNGTSITPVTDGVVAQRKVSFGQPINSLEKRLAVLYKNPDGIIRAFVFRRVTCASADSSITFAKTGEQQTLALEIKVLSEYTPDIRERFVTVFEQSLVL